MLWCGGSYEVDQWANPHCRASGAGSQIVFQVVPHVRLVTESAPVAALLMSVMTDGVAQTPLAGDWILSISSPEGEFDLPVRRLGRWLLVCHPGGGAAARRRTPTGGKQWAGRRVYVMLSIYGGCFPWDGSPQFSRLPALLLIYCF